MSANTTKAPLEPAALAQAQRDELLWAIEYAVRFYVMGRGGQEFLSNAFRKVAGHEVGPRA